MSQLSKADGKWHDLELKKKRTFRKFSYRGIDLDEYVPPSMKVIHSQSLCSQSLEAATDDVI